MAKVSIVIPTFNRYFLIEETLDSIFQQSYQDWECIVVDDHSTDDTANRVLQYVNQDPRVKLFFNERIKGAQGARNTGIAKASGEYIIFLDSDDCLSKNCLRNRLDLAFNNPDYHYYCFSTAVFNKKPYDTNLMWNYLDMPENDLIRFVKNDNPWHTSGVLWKKDTLIYLDGWDEKLSCWQDWDMHLRAVIDPRLKFLKSTNNDIDSFYRVDEGYQSISDQELSKNSIQSKVYLVDKFSALLPLTQKHVRLEFARLIYRISIEVLKSGCKKYAVSLLHKLMRDLNFPWFYSQSWCLYLYFKYDNAGMYPGFLIRPLGLIPRIYRNRSLLDNSRTHLRAVFNAVSIK